MDSVFRRLLRFTPKREAPIVYPIGNFSMTPSYYKIKIFTKCRSGIALCSKRLNVQLGTGNRDIVDAIVRRNAVRK